MSGMSDLEIGRRIRDVRASAQLSQAALARRMFNHGHAWQQQTVYKVECGGRAVKLSEALDLCICLGIQVSTLLGLSDVTAAYKAERRDFLVREINRHLVSIEELEAELGPINAAAVTA